MSENKGFEIDGFDADWEGYKEFKCGHAGLPESLFTEDKTVFILAYQAGYERRSLHLQSLLASKDAEIKRMSMSLKTASEYVPQLEQRLKDKDAEIIKIQKSWQESEKKLNEWWKGFMEQETKKLEQRLKDKDAEISDLKQCLSHDIGFAKGLIEEKDAEIALLQSELCALKQQIDFGHKRESELATKLGKTEAELYQQRFNNEHNLSIDQKIADELKAKDAEIEELKKENGEFDKYNLELISESCGLKQRLRDAEEVVGLAVDKFNAFKADVDEHYSQDYYKFMKDEAKPLETRFYAVYDIGTKAREYQSKYLSTSGASVPEAPKKDE